MTVLLIVLAVIAVLLIILLSISAEFTIIFDNGWTTKVKVLFIEKDVELTKLLSFLVAPDKAGAEAAEKSKEKKKEKKKKDDTENETSEDKETPEYEETAESSEDSEVSEEKGKDKKKKEDKEEEKKPGALAKIYKQDGIVGVMLFFTNLLQTVNSALTTLIKGLHIYSIYVKMIIGGGDAATIGEKYGALCGWYYPLKGMIMNQMKVYNYDDLIIPDFIAPRSEYEFQFIGSISVGLLLKSVLKAGKVFLVNFIKNK